MEIFKSNIDNTAIESSNEFTALEQALLEVGDITNKLDTVGDSKDCTVTFTEVTTEMNIVSGDTHSTLFRKILKSIKTFRTAIGTLSNLSTTVKTSLVLTINWLNSKVINAIALDYSASSTYAVGAYRFYENVLYKCTTTITVAEAWNVSHWTAVKLGDEVSEKNKDLAT